METQHKPPHSIYIVGAQCTGKTTLAGALLSKINGTPVNMIKEVARSVLRDYQFDRDDITNSPEKALELQRLILRAQHDAEVANIEMLISDRSGIDPIVYAAKYGPSGGADMLLASGEWQVLRTRMTGAVVILCPPRKEWLQDDGVRLMANDWQEWLEVHQLFEKLLERCGISYVTIPEELSELPDRVGFVLQRWHYQSA
ncbi:hypothetical protein ABW19_dt0203725 [Dactylella cylindrospora]|nr:hypothetical protein ABW19_dt0203725 [Dactylella cylindrospora]